MYTVGWMWVLACLHTAIYTCIYSYYRELVGTRGICMILPNAFKIFLLHWYIKQSFKRNFVSNAEDYVVSLFTPYITYPCNSYCVYAPGALFLSAVYVQHNIDEKFRTSHHITRHRIRVAKNSFSVKHYVFVY